VLPVPPAGLRPRLKLDQVTDLSMVHNANLDAIAKGIAGEDVLWDWVGSVFTWSKAAELLQAGVPEMLEQLRLATELIERYARTGRIAFDGPGYQLAKDGVAAMDQLAEIIDRPNALAAADWSERKVNALAAECRRRDAEKECHV